MTDKQRIKQRLAALLAAELDAMVRALQAAREGATHEEAKPENDKDTRALEQSYLAHGQGKRVEELRAGLAAVQTMNLRSFADGLPIALGALVTIDEEGQERRVFVAPYGGGAVVDAIQVITPRSPIGRAILGKREGESVVAEISGRPRDLDIVEVQ